MVDADLHDGTIISPPRRLHHWSPEPVKLGQVIARSLREQIDWPQLQGRTASSPYSGAFFTLCQALAIAPQHGRGRGAGLPRVRVLPGGS